MMQAATGKLVWDATGRTTYTFDAVDRVRSVTDPAGKLVTYSYDAAGQRSVMIEPDGGRFMEMTREMQNSRLMLYTFRLDRIANSSPGLMPSTPAWERTKRITYSFDAAGQRRAIVLLATIGKGASMGREPQPTTRSRSNQAARRLTGGLPQAA